MTTFKRRGGIPKDDPELKAMTEGVILMAKSTGGFAVTSGFISHGTKQMLDKINVR